MCAASRSRDEHPEGPPADAFVEDDGGLVLEVETFDGVFVRRVLPASTLPTGAEVGPAAEDATRSAAATFGLPDFVFRSARLATGSGTRELGDAIVAVGDIAAVIQVKARGATSGQDARERAWLDKRVGKAARQARGTIRKMSAKDATLINERGRAVRIAGPSKSWVPVVIVDHPSPPIDYVPASTTGVVLLRRDWEFLFEQLKSTDAVIRYLNRVSSMPAVPIGQEPVRYYELAAADAAAPPGPLNPRLVRPGMKSASIPVLPQAPAGFQDRQYHVLLRVLLEDVATAPRPDGFDEAHMLDAVAAVDTLPVGYRAELGKTLLSWLHEVAAEDTDQVRWRFRQVQFPDRPHLIFAAATRWNKAVHNAFSMLVTIRHQEMYEALQGGGTLLTVGLLLTPRRDGRRPWDTTMAAVLGDLELSAEYRKELERLWPVRPAPN
jgi:hypothetical protein